MASRLPEAMPCRRTASLTARPPTSTSSPRPAEGDFPAAVDAVLAALQGDGLAPKAEIRNSSFARIALATPDGGATKIEMGVGWRANQPSRLSIGPVLHPDDAVPNKVCALFGRAEVRDYVDVDAIPVAG